MSLRRYSMRRRRLRGRSMRLMRKMRRMLT
jgi:hypothetical protein